MKNLFKKIGRKYSAFTLIELLVVITIIGILSTVVVLNVQDSRAKARNAKRKSDLNTIASALEAYYADNNAYPFGEGFVWPDGWHGPDVRNVAISTSAREISQNMVDAYPGVQMRDLYNRSSKDWLWVLSSRGYIDKNPTDPINLKGNVFGANNFIGNLNTGQPGFLYIYLNDEPDPITCSYQIIDSSGSNTPYDPGHAQQYKLLAALERPDADQDYRNDSGCYNYPPVTFTNVGDLNLGELRAGLMYEVSSSGAANASEFCFNPGHIITMADLQADTCY